MKIAVSNSSPLILLAKINSLDILFYFFDTILIPPAVYKELVEKGMKKGVGDAILIQKLVEENKIKIKTLENTKLPLFPKKSLH